MPGVEQQIGIGKAQVLPRLGNNTDFVQQLNEQKFRQERQNIIKDQAKKDDDARLYGILGDQFNPRNFNAVVHDRLRQAKADLAAKIRSGQMSYGDVYMEASGKAGEIANLSDKFNKIDATLAATRSEYEKYDKGLNTANIEYEARKRIYDQYRSGQPVDENINWFDDTLSNMGSGALNYKGTAGVNFLPEEKQSLTGSYKKRNAVGRVTGMDYKADVYPSVYDVKDNGQDPVTISTKTEPSGLKDANGADIPMLSEAAYRRWAMLPSKRKEYDERIIEKYGNVPLGSEQAEKLRRIEAYQDAEAFKPKVNEKTQELAPLPPRITVNVGGNGSGDANGIKGNEFDRIEFNAGGVDIKDGVVKTNEGNMFTGNVRVMSKLIPAQIQAILKSAGIDIGSEEYLRLKVENGKIQALIPEESGKTIDRTDMENAQKKWNTEGQKAAQPAFGERDGKTKGGYKWNGYDYTEDEVKQGAAAEKLSVDEYLKKHGIKKN